MSKILGNPVLFVGFLLLIIGDGAVIAQIRGRAYIFGPASFSNFVWVKNGEALKEPKLVEIEMSNSGAFGLEVYDDSDRLVSKGERGNDRGGRSVFDFRAGMNPPVPSGCYKLKLVNRTSGVREVIQGRVFFAM